MGSTLWPVNGTFTGRQLRQAVGAFWGGLIGRPLGARSGVVVGTPTNTVTATSTTWTVKPHSGVLDIEPLAIAGAYNYALDANFTGDMNVADSFNDRIDLISVTMTDQSEGDGSTAGPIFNYTPGTAAATPLPPATPARNIALATIRVPKATTGSPSVTWVAPWVVAAGGILPCRGPVDYPTSPYVGQYIDDATLGLLRWDGSNWDRGNIDTGWVNMGVKAGFAAQPGFTPQARLIGNRTSFQGGLSGSPMAASTAYTAVLTFPASMAPNNTLYIPVGTNSASTIALVVVNVNGTVDVRTGPIAPGYLMLPSVTFLID